jgi:GNAT superfamily N-acetyltransferase
MNTKKFVHLDGEGKSWGIVSAEQLWANVYALKYNRPEERLDREIWKNLFAQAKAAAISFGAETIGARLRKEYEAEMFRSILAETGLKKISERVEYQCDISLLLDDSGSPLQWKTAKELNWDTKKIAQFTGDITKEALDVDPDEKPEDFVQDWLHHDEFTSGADCIAVGFLDGIPCALVVAQINKETGWSRLSYMGIIPEFRGKKLGKWVHRHGFQMMKAQGGKLYHGGTHGENLPMKKLFESHGCKMFCEMEEWSVNLKGGV